MEDLEEISIREKFQPYLGIKDVISLDKSIKNAFNQYKNNADEIEKLALEASMLMNASQAKQNEIIEQPFWKKIWKDFTGKNNKIRDEENNNTIKIHYCALQVQRILLDNNKITFQTIQAMHSKVNLFEQKTNEEINEIYYTVGKVREESINNISILREEQSKNINKLAEQTARGLKHLRKESIVNIKNLERKTANKFNALEYKLYKSFRAVEDEFDKIKNIADKNFKSFEEKLLNVNKKLKNLEHTQAIQTYVTTMFQNPKCVFDGKKYVKLNPIEKVICISNDFYCVAKGHIKLGDINFLYTALGDCGIKIEDKIKLKDFYGKILCNPNLKDKYFESIKIDNIKNIPTYYIPLSKTIDEKIEENYQKPLMSNPALDNIKKYLTTEVNIDIDKEISFKELSLLIIAELCLLEKNSAFKKIKKIKKKVISKKSNKKKNISNNKKVIKLSTKKTKIPKPNKKKIIAKKTMKLASKKIIQKSSIKNKK